MFIIFNLKLFVFRDDKRLVAYHGCRSVEGPGSNSPSMWHQRENASYKTSEVPGYRLRRMWEDPGL